jgi:hypothetical protein
LDSSLKRFETAKSAAMFAHVYEVLERATDPSDIPEPEVMNENLENVKTFLYEARTATYTQFRCLGVESPF